jgi:XRE family transcriptional regulator, regulator of sulfur utilization
MRKPLLAPLAAAAILGSTLSSAEQPVQGSFAITWEEIQSKPTGTSGMARSVLRSPTATLDELEIHVTALPAGKTTHAPHTHANEEMIVIREGTLDAYQNGKVTRVGPGSLLFMGSNEPHNVTNVGTTTAVYHVINWASPGMKRSSSASPGDDVRAFYRDLRQAGALRGAEGYASFFAEDAVLLPPNALPLSGRVAIREWQERSRAEAGDAGTPPSIEEDELQMSGAFVIYRSTLKGQRAAKAGAVPEPFETKYFDVLRRKPDGGYEIVRRMWSSNLR